MNSIALFPIYKLWVKIKHITKKFSLHFPYLSIQETIQGNVIPIFSVSYPNTFSFLTKKMFVSLWLMQRHKMKSYWKITILLLCVFFIFFPWWFSGRAINRRMLIFLGMYSVLLEPIQLGFCFKRKEINQNPQSNTAILMWVSSFFGLYLFSWWFSHQTTSTALRNSHARYIKKMNQQNLIMICKIIIKSSV